MIYEAMQFLRPLASKADEERETELMNEARELMRPGGDKARAMQLLEEARNLPRSRGGGNAAA